MVDAGDAGLVNLTDKSFEPKPSTPEVVPVGGRLEIRCLPAKGLPTPVHRFVLCFCHCLAGSLPDIVLVSILLRDGLLLHLIVSCYHSCCVPNGFCNDNGHV